MNTSLSDVGNAMNMDTFSEISLSIPPPRGKLKRNQRKELPRFNIEGDKHKRIPQPTMEKITQIIIYLKPLTTSQKQKS
jgi:hypothetical protein